MPTKKWTEEEEEFLRNNYMDLSNAELAEKYGITKNAVQKKLARMGLKRSKAQKKPPSDEVIKPVAVEEKAPEVISAESHLSLANKLYYDDRNYEEAINEYKKAVKEETDELIKLKARYWMAESHVKLEEKKKAMKLFKSIAEEYEGHYLGDSAKRRLSALTDYIVPAT
jgi:TolA-binding protein